MKLKILLLNGSPRKNGTVSRLLNEVCSFLRNDFEAEIVNANDLEFAYCRGCMACRKSLKCVLPHDDAHEFAEKMRNCDVLIVASPCYWGNIPGKLKMLFDRIVYIMMEESRLGIPKPLHKGKKCFVIASSTTPFPFNIIANQSNGVVRALREILSCSGFRISGVIQKGGTKKKNVNLSSELKKCRKIAKKINQMKEVVK